MLRTISITLDQGCFIIRQANLVKEFPAVFGEGDQKLELSVYTRSKIMEGLRQIKRQLYEKQSREFKDDDLLYFGEKKLYKRIESTEKEVDEKGLDPVRYEPLDRKKTVDIEVSPSMELGFGGLFLLWMRPDSPGVQMFMGQMQPPLTVVGQLTVGQMNDLAWPLIEQLQMKGWADKFLGLGAPDTMEIIHDDEKKPEEPAEKK